MELQKSAQGDITILSVKGNITIANRDQLRSTLDDLLKNKIVQVVIDGTELGYIDSSGLGVLSLKVKKFKEANGNLAFANLSNMLLHELELTRLDQVFSVFDTTAEAISSFS